MAIAPITIATVAFNVSMIAAVTSIILAPGLVIKRITLAVSHIGLTAWKVNCCYKIEIELTVY